MISIQPLRVSAIAELGLMASERLNSSRAGAMSSAMFQIAKAAMNLRDAHCLVASRCGLRLAVSRAARGSSPAAA